MVRSIAHVFFHAAQRAPDLPAFREAGQDGRVWTYGELALAVRETALGLSTLGIAPGDRIGLFADNSINWILSDLAVLSLGAADVPRGTDTPPGEADYLIRHSGARVVILQNRKVLDELAPTLADIADLRCIILQEGSFREGDPRPVLSLDEVRERGRRRIEEGADITPFILQTRGNDIATIVYTSGTTGKPKGVVLTHDNILHNIRAVPAVVRFSTSDVFLSILPAWHMFERLIEYAAISKSCLTVYTSKRTFKQDLLRVRPTVLAAVPRVFELLYEEARRRFSEGAALRRLLVNALLRCSAHCRRGVLHDPISGTPYNRWGRLLTPLHQLGERLVYRRFRAALGGRLRTLVSGGGSLPGHVDQFFDMVGLPLLNGYGLTETAPLVAVRLHTSRVLGTVGPAVPGTEVEVRTEEGDTLGTGEVGILHVRGPQVMHGYYRNSEATSRVVDGGGFLNTGDLARIYRDGEIEITGRAKDTIVLRGGENIEPEPIENALRLSPLIEQVVVLGQDQKQLGALIVPDREALSARLPVTSQGGSEFGLNDEQPRQLLRAEMDRLLHRARGFKPYEQVRRFRLLERPFSTETGELTETLKLKRHVIGEQYRNMISALFAE